MKVTRAQCDAHHKAIIGVARRFREHGFNAVTLSDVMREAGLTHGAFYGHFSSKEGLAVSAVASASTNIAAYWQSVVEGLGRRGLDAVARGISTAPRCRIRTGAPSCGAQSRRRARDARPSPSGGIGVLVNAAPLYHGAKPEPFARKVSPATGESGKGA